MKNEKRFEQFWAVCGESRTQDMDEDTKEKFFRMARDAWTAGERSICENVENSTIKFIDNLLEGK